MSQEIKMTLQSVLDSIERPAFIKKDSKIFLMNDMFGESGYTQAVYREVEQNKCTIVERAINNNMKICEIVDNDVYRLGLSRQKLTKAITLL